MSIAVINYAVALLRRQALLDRDKGTDSIRKCCLSFLCLSCLNVEAASVITIARDGVAIAVLDEAQTVESRDETVD